MIGIDIIRKKRKASSASGGSVGSGISTPSGGDALNALHADEADHANRADEATHSASAKELDGTSSVWNTIRTWISGATDAMKNVFLRKDQDDSTPYTLGMQNAKVVDKVTASAEFTAKLGDVTLTFPGGNFDVEYTGAQLTDLTGAFREKSGLTSITSFGVDISKVKKITNFIYGCKNIVSVDFTGCDFSGVQGAGKAFCSQYFPNDTWTTIKGGMPGIHDCSQLSFKYLNALTKESIVGVINTMGTSKWSPTFILSETQKAALSATEKAVIINKGWTLA